MDLRQLERIADIEGNERLVNERALATTNAGLDRIRVRCECGDDGCHEPVTVRRAVYEKARADSMLFILLPGHVMVEAEDVVERSDGWEVVRKHENMRDRVERSDPRRA